MSLIDCNQPPSDGITRLRFNYNDKSLLATSWDGSAHLFNPQSGEPQAKVPLGSPVLDGVWLKDNRSFVAGSLAGELTLVDATHEQKTLIGTHEGAARCVSFHRDTGLVFSGGWGGELQVYDTRVGAPVVTVNLPSKVYCLDVSGRSSYVCAGLADKSVQVFDIRSLNEPMDVKDSVLKFQLRSLACFPDGRGFAAGSIEGKVAWEYFDGQIPDGQKSYVFKCHREKYQQGGEAVWPVNTLACHPVYGSFVTGGGDGTAHLWDGRNRKRLWKLPKPMLTSISASALSSDDLLAMGVSYDYSQGPQPPARPQHNATEKDVLLTSRIVIRSMKTEEVEPKMVE